MNRRRTYIVGAVVVAEVALHVVWNLWKVGGEWATLVFGDVVLTVVPILAAIACFLAARRSRHRERRAWALLGAAALSWGIGDAVWAYHEIVARREVPFPSLADLGSLGLIPLAAVAVVVFPAAPAAARSRARTLADGLILAASLMFMSWAAILGPTVRAGADNALGAVVAVAYPFGDVVIMAAVLFVVARAPRGGRTPFALIGSGLVALAAADSGFLYLTLRDQYSTGSLVSVGWNLGFALVALAAVRSGATAGTEAAPRRPRVAAVVLPYAGVGLVTVTASVQWVRNGTIEAFLFWDTIAIVVLVVARQLLGMLEIMGLTRGLEATVEARTAQLQASERRFRSLVQYSSDVVTVVDRSGTIEYQSDSVTRVFGYEPRDLVGLALDDAVHPGDRLRVATVLSELAGRDGRSAQLEFRMRHRDGSWRSVETTVSNLLADSSVGGLVLNVRDVSSRKVLEEQLAHQAFHDSLTGLANRALFSDRVQGALERAARRGTSVAMLYLDLDGFKTVNDTHGHQAGDELLVCVADRMRDAARGADTVARFGGDEFAVLLEDLSSCDDARAVAGRILEAFETRFRVADRELYVYASIGISLSSPDSCDPGELLRNADVAMYMAKTRGKRRFEVFDPVMHAAVVERVELEADLHDALDRNELELHYQPIVDLPTGGILGVEALLRWNHPTRGSVSPADFIPVAEDSGLIVSVRQLHEPQFVGDVLEALVRHGLDPGCLVLEITESVLLDDRFDALQLVHALKELGVQLAIDDFGTGYSSLGYLRDLPIDTLKIDRSFVQLLGGSPEDSALARAIVKLGQTLHLHTVAEGIELPVQRDELLKAGCASAQGFYYSRPVDAASLEALLRSGRPLPDPDPTPAPQEASHALTHA
ncbi:MAG: EAL domain-containing protein [Actinobacteria bacterium]|nr:EAL domain-containing protein [Actinomycetota bacterium]